MLNNEQNRWAHKILWGRKMIHMDNWSCHCTRIQSSLGHKGSTVTKFLFFYVARKNRIIILLREQKKH